jgi:hypothetical protein
MKKQFYNLLCAFGISTIFTIIPASGNAQCLCEGGLTPDSVVHNQYYDSITSVNTSLSFPQFNPATGMLVCFNLESTVTTVLEFDLFNKESFPDDYTFESFRRSRFAGPDGFFTNINSPTKEYGPYSLGPIDPGGSGDEIHIGPDTVFNARFSSINRPGSAGYIGNGTFSFDYLNTSTTTLLDGSSNYDLFVRGYTRLNVRLVYYWCPTLLLASAVKNFAAVKKDKNIRLNWLVDNKDNHGSYEIEISYDGRQFTGLGPSAAHAGENSPSAAYQYQFNAGQVTARQLYFRVKHTNASGKVTYSVIRMVNLEENASGNMDIYPNPVIRKVGMQFDRELTGSYKIQLINQVGQVVYNRLMRLNNQSNVQVDLANVPAPGVYYLQVVSAESKEIYNKRVLIQR